MDARRASRRADARLGYDMLLRMTSVVTVGVLTPHAAAGPEAELPDMAPGQVITQVSRIPAKGATVDSPGSPPTSPAGLRALAEPQPSMRRRLPSLPEWST